MEIIAGFKYISLKSDFSYFYNVYNKLNEQFNGVLNSCENELINIDWNRYLSFKSNYVSFLVIFYNTII